MNKKKFMIIISVLVIGIITVWALMGHEVKIDVTYDSAKVENHDVSNSVTATGTIEPITQVEVGTQVSGIVNKLYVDYNSIVKKGQVIAELDKVNLLNELASKTSNVATSKTEYEYQLKNYTRIKTLHEKTLVSDNDYDTAYYSYEKAKNAYDISKNELSKAQTNLGYATVYSPIDGIVLSKEVEEGQTVAASFSTPTLFKIAQDLTQMQVVANVDEADIGDVKEGQNVSFTVDAFPNDTFEGKVTQVRQEATTESNVVTYEVVINAPNPDTKLKPGLTANVTIFILDKKDVLSVPSKALRFTPEVPLIAADDIVKDVDAKHKLWVREGKIFKAYAVEVGINNGTLTEIVSGIPNGTVVVTDAVIGQQPKEDAEADKKESSPFMPSHPSSNKKK